MPKVNILGVDIDSKPKKEILEDLGFFLKSDRPHLITTPNPEILLQAQENQELRNILNKSDLAIPDGFGLILASLYLKNKIKQRITGVDLMLDLCLLASQKNYSVYLLGGLGRVPEKTAIKLIKEYPSLKIAGYDNGFRGWGWRLSDSTIIEKINRVKPDILFVAYGAPKQEKWLYHYLPKLKTVKIGMGVGGAFDYISGQVKRAPLVMRKIGLEWLFRLYRQPWRFPRIVKATAYFSSEVLKNKRKIK
ncbi:MAG: WecB/TagA/CpsF family glycosyltransferase [Patescibacteria group bacterium]